MPAAAAAHQAARARPRNPNKEGQPPARSRDVPLSRQVSRQSSWESHINASDQRHPKVDLSGWHLALRGVHKLQGCSFREQRVVITDDALALGEADKDIDSMDDVIPLHEACAFVCIFQHALCVRCLRETVVGVMDRVRPVLPGTVPLRLSM